MAEIEKKHTIDLKEGKTEGDKDLILGYKKHASSGTKIAIYDTPPMDTVKTIVSQKRKNSSKGENEEDSEFQEKIMRAEETILREEKEKIMESDDLTKEEQNQILENVKNKLDHKANDIISKDIKHSIAR